MTENLKFLMQRVASRKFHNVKVNDELLAGVNHVCNQVIHSILYYSFPEIGQQLSNLYASCETPETWDHDYRIGIKAAVSYFLNKEELFNTK